MGNVVSNFLLKDTLLNIKGQYMKESITLAGNAIKIFFQRKVLPDTRELYIKVTKN